MLESPPHAIGGERGDVGSTTPVCRKCSRNQPNALGSVFLQAPLASSIREEALQDRLAEIVGLQVPAAHPLTEVGDHTELLLPRVDRIAILRQLAARTYPGNRSGDRRGGAGGWPRSGNSGPWRLLLMPVRLKEKTPELCRAFTAKNRKVRLA